MKILLSALMVCLYLGCSSTSEKEPQINTNPNIFYKSVDGVWHLPAGETFHSLNYRDWIIITKTGGSIGPKTYRAYRLDSPNGSGYNKAELYEIIKEN